jgi:hypothetical protein
MSFIRLESLGGRAVEKRARVWSSMPPYAPSRAQILRLYATTLRHAKVFPSRNRALMVEDIRAEFREARGLTDARAVELAWEKGVRGLDTMKKYTTLDKRSPNWVVELEQNPLGLDGQGAQGPA